MLAGPAPAGAGLPAVLQQLTAALRTRGIAGNDVRAAFGEEMEMIGDWPADARWPVLEAKLPVKDAGRARKIADALTSVEISGTPWIRTEKSGATIYRAQPFGFLTLSPGIAVSDQMMIVGTDAAAIETAITGTAPAGELEESAIFQSAAKQVPAGQSAFNYVDTRLLFERLDASLRPLLLMGAAFRPSWGRMSTGEVAAARGDRETSFTDRDVATL